jgi:hypothetical protein
MIFDLPVPGSMVPASQVYIPVLLKGVTVDPQDPFRFDFIVDNGQTKLRGEALKEQSLRLVNYFLAAMTIASDDLWVNLSPVEKDRIIPDALVKTELGQGLLAQDYMLKQLASTLMYPEADLGKEFWARVYAQAQGKYGVADIPTDTFNKVWITPDTATIYEKGHTVYVVNAKLKVMLDSDHLAERQLPTTTEASTFSTTTDDIKNIMRSIILPAIEKEVNTGKNFAPLRQIYYSLILAKWYKEKIKTSILSQVYIDQSKVKGIDLSDPAAKQEIYDRYMQAYKKGVYNYVKEELDPATQEVIPRKYFSGGFKDKAMTFDHIDSSEEINLSAGDSSLLSVRIETLAEGDDRSPAKRTRPKIISDIIENIKSGLIQQIDLNEVLKKGSRGRRSFKVRFYDTIDVASLDEDDLTYIQHLAVPLDIEYSSDLVNDLKKADLNEPEVQQIIDAMKGLKASIILPGTNDVWVSEWEESVIAQHIRQLNRISVLEKPQAPTVNAAIPVKRKVALKDLVPASSVSLVDYVKSRVDATGRVPMGKIGDGQHEMSLYFDIETYPKGNTVDLNVFIDGEELPNTKVRLTLSRDGLHIEHFFVNYNKNEMNADFGSQNIAGRVLLWINRLVDVLKVDVISSFLGTRTIRLLEFGLGRFTDEISIDFSKSWIDVRQWREKIGFYGVEVVGKVRLKKKNAEGNSFRDEMSVECVKLDKDKDGRFLYRITAFPPFDRSLDGKVVKFVNRQMILLDGDATDYWAEKTENPVRFRTNHMLRFVHAWNEKAVQGSMMLPKGEVEGDPQLELQIVMKPEEYGLGEARIFVNGVLSATAEMVIKGGVLYVNVAQSFEESGDSTLEQRMRARTLEQLSKIAQDQGLTVRFIENSKDFSDDALQQAKNVGGIDMNNIVLKESVQGQGIVFDSQAISSIANKKVDGFTPVIISLTPVNNIFSHLGLK